MKVLTPEQKKALIKKWSDPAKEKMSIDSLKDEYLKENLAQLLENQSDASFARNMGMSNSFSSMNEVAGISTTSVGDTNAQFQPIALALVRRTFPELFANKVVGVQAMSGPVGLAYALRFVYGDAASLAGVVEAGFQKVPNYTGYSGNLGASAATADSGTAETRANAEAWAIGSTMQQLKLIIDKTSITAGTRKLAANFSLEAAQDIQAMHGIDIEREMVNILQYEIMAELDRELIAKLKAAAVVLANGGEAAITYSVSASPGRHAAEKFADIVNIIVKKANDIATATRRNAGNFVIVSPRVAAALANCGTAFTQTKYALETQADVLGMMVEVGTIHGSIKVYRDMYASTDYALVGYKGPGVSDAGIIYSPYVTGLISKAITQEDFSPRVGVMSRYALTDNLLGSGRYYRLINFDSSLQNVFQG